MMALSPASSHGGGSFDAVGIVLTRTNVSLKGAAQHSIAWNAAADNPYDFNTITSVPSGLGMTIPIDGSSAVIATTTAGVWYLELRATVAYDATFQAIPGFGFGAYGDVWVPATVGVAHSAEFQGSTVAELPSGAVLGFSVTTQVDATAGAYTGDMTGTIVRLA